MAFLQPTSRFLWRNGAEIGEILDFKCIEEVLACLPHREYQTFYITMKIIKIHHNVRVNPKSSIFQKPLTGSSYSFSELT